MLLGFAGLIAGCGGSSRAISVISPGTPQLQAISVGPSNPTLNIGLTQQFTATGVYTDGSKKDLSNSVTWKSGAVNVATISNTGLATAISLGASAITATFGSVIGSTTLTVGGASLVTIDITPSTPSIALGTQQQFVATGVYSDFTTKNISAAVTWVSSTPTVATITPQGLAVSVHPGTSTITATLGSVFGTTNLTVKGAVLVSIAIKPANASVPKGASQAVVAVGTFTDGTLQNVTALATWNSSNPTLVTVAAQPGGTESATGQMLGTVTITAAVGAIAGTTQLTVTAATLVAITVTPANPSIASGFTQQFVATGVYTDQTTMPLTATAIWASSAPVVATITNAAGTEGVAQALAPGATTITATLGTIVGFTTLTVTAATLQSIAITPTNPVISVTATQQFTAIGTFSNNTLQDVTTLVTWVSGTVAVATISNAGGSNGLATGIAEGTTPITAILNGVTSNTATLTVAAAFCYSLDFDRNNPNNQGVLYEFAITPPNGDLVPLVDPATNLSTVATGFTPFALTVDSTRQYVYVANYNFGNVPGSISQYTKAPTGLLTPMTPATVAVANGPNGITAHPQLGYVYVASLDGNTISQFTIGAGGALALASVEAAPTLGPASVALAVNAAGTTNTFAYVADYNTSSVSQYQILIDGSLLALTPATVPAGSLPSFVVVHPNGLYVYVVDQGTDPFGDIVSEYTIQTNGTLLPMATVATDTQPVSITLDAAGANAYVTNRGAGTVFHYAVGMNGQLTFADSVLTTPGAASLAIDPSGRYAYVADRAGATLSEFLIGLNGMLTPFAAPNTTIPAGTEPDAAIATR